MAGDLSRAFVGSGFVIVRPLNLGRAPLLSFWG